MILHIDMDAFYASIEERDNPSLVGKPVVVGGSAEGRGVVAAANYEARKFGVHSAMAAARAKRLCPHAIFLKPRIDHYAEVSRQIRVIFEQFTPLVEPLSLDEAFLDVTGSEALFGPSAEIGRQIKQQIRDKLHLVASVGVATNKFIAKIASDVQKPDGFVVVESHEIQTFLDPLPVGRLWGVGKVTGQVFEQMSIGTIGQLRHVPLNTLIDWFGSSGEHYWQLAHGIDERRVVPDREAKSISNETTFAEDITDPDVLRAWLVELVEQVARRLRQHDIKGRTVDLKVRFANFKTISRSLTLPEPTNITHELLEVGIELLTKRLPSRHPPVRLLGFGVNKLDGSGTSQQQLFDRPDRNRHQDVDRVADQITAKFGKLALRRGARLDTSDD
ncbi:MAG: DNA polymerase IV [Planctomycetota bacterium]|nr:DNA polymerase IV [Planctomycetota bacterium]MDA1213709.1 DNA polymerase IV [Planctomycetota bacterium]